jgi:hypothetical protein
VASGSEEAMKKRASELNKMYQTGAYKAQQFR